MTETIEIICDVEEAIADLQAMADPRCPDPNIESKIRRLDNRLRQIQASEPVFSRPA